MVKTKHQKPKPKKQQPQAKKHGKNGKKVGVSEFRAQLDVLGLKIIEVTGDGNCFFRSLADQLEGSEHEHRKYRSKIVQFIMKNRERFEPFVDDDVPFDEYCKSMEKDGEWAGHMESQAASLLTCRTICIHQHMAPRWYIRNIDNHVAPEIHLSYHDGQHYNSVRLEEDPCDGPAKPIFIKADINLTATSQQAKATEAQLKSRTSKTVVHRGAIKMVMAGSSCEDAEKAEQALLQVDGDVDAAIEFLIANRKPEDTVEENGFVSENDYCGYDRSRNFKKNDENAVSANENDPTISARSIDGSKLSDKVDKKIPRNKVCPCGSKKKYKACCGVASGRTCSKLVSDQEAYSRSRTDKRGKQGKKVAPVTKPRSCGSDEPVLDIGALCI